ncbi:MAG: response regulator [Campylobacterota bacterium]|nr:response regulator [Campylobacterota bacterium]
MNKNQYHILIVDDEEINIEIVSSILEAQEYQISSSLNGKDALQKLFSNKYDLVLLDINMPDMNGFTVCERLKKDSQTKDIPVIFFSAESDLEFITKAFNLGAVDYIPKPFNGAELLARVNTHIKIRAYTEDIELKTAKLSILASTDNLTKIANRIRYISVLKHYCSKISSEETNLCLIYMHINNLDKVNEINGYRKGDQILQRFVKDVNINLKDNDFFARILAAEFAIILPKTSLSYAITQAKKIKNHLDNDSYFPNVTFSFGVVEYIKDESIDIFSTRALRMMKESKSIGSKAIAHQREKFEI